jgi:soluble lytic murein transglycosylase-like protein
MLARPSKCGPEGGAGTATRIALILASVAVCLVAPWAAGRAAAETRSQADLSTADVVVDTSALDDGTQDTDADARAQSPADLPKPLGSEDAKRYARIFALQRDGHWKEADALIARLHDKLLMGRVLAQRYLHPTLYRSSYKELHDWLAQYRDEPEAKWIHELALKRKPRRAAAPASPVGGYLNGSGYDVEADQAPPHRSSRELSARDRGKSDYLKSRVRAITRAGALARAKEMIATAEARHLLDPVERDMARAEIAAGAFALGRDEDALEIAGEVTHRGEVPEADWIAGLAAWRLGDAWAAAEHFEAVVDASSVSPWQVAAGAYWAARANLVARRPDRVTRYLQIAAAHDHTFYGIVARRALAMENGYDWRAPSLDADRLALLMRSDWGRRALALLQVGRLRRAEQELRRAYAGADADTADAILALALEGNLPGLAMRIGVERLRQTGEIQDAALYPVPSWRPKGGFKVDRALLLAVMRQESNFDAEAESGAGAVGLMQIMPDTARFLGGARPDGDVDDALLDPERNMALGQKYLAHLLEDAAVRGNLFLLAAAYNGGPGKLAQWQRRVDYGDDPLLFIESIPVRETRAFIERVFCNMWIYQQRLGQPSPSLDSVVAGEWPRYAALDSLPVEVANRDGN